MDESTLYYNMKTGAIFMLNDLMIQIDSKEGRALMTYYVAKCLAPWFDGPMQKAAAHATRGDRDVRRATRWGLPARDSVRERFKRYAHRRRARLLRARSSSRIRSRYFFERGLILRTKSV
jgi:hypothetical protein